MTEWPVPLVDELARREHFGYGGERDSAAEPAALASLALTAWGRQQAAQRPLAWLARAQQRRGVVGVRGRGHDAPWPTALALLAWRWVLQQRTTFDPELADRIRRATDSLLSLRGKRGEHTRDLVGHDASLVAWSWVEGTHSWLEPTALAVMALKSEGLSDHPRTREAVRLLLDRQLPDGGCNYGNTTVLGQVLRPHPQPSAMTLLALVGEPSHPRITRSLDYLHRVYPQVTASVSLSWIVLGLAAYDALPPGAEERLQAAFTRYPSGTCPPYIASLLALAALGPLSPLIRLPREGHGAVAGRPSARQHASLTAESVP